MIRCAIVGMTLAMACGISGCKDVQKQSSGQTPAKPASRSAATDSSREDLRNVMQSKMTFANSLIGSMAVGNFESIELNAMQLSWLSLQAEWQVHDTPEYTHFSEDFRQIAETMANHARQKDLAAVTRDYSQLTASCIECHTYLRHDRSGTDVPGYPQ